jgi:hypothetical protein
MTEVFKQNWGKLNHHVSHPCSVSTFRNGQNRWFFVALTEGNSPRT